MLYYFDDFDDEEKKNHLSWFNARCLYVVFSSVMT